MMSRKSLEQASPWILLVLVLLVWELLCRAFNVSEFVFPSPSKIALALQDQAGLIAGHAWRTFWVTMAGFGIAIVIDALVLYGLNEFLGRRMREPLTARGIDVERLRVE